MEGIFFGEGGSLPKRTFVQILSEKIGLAKQENIGRDQAYNSLVSAVRFTQENVRDVARYLDRPDKKDKYEPSLRILLPWMAYGDTLYENPKVPTTTLESYANLTAYLFETTHMDQMVSFAHQKPGWVEHGYGRLGQTTMYTNNELDYIFTHADASRRARHLDDVEDVVAWGQKQHGNDATIVYMEEPISSLPEFYEYEKRVQKLLENMPVRNRHLSIHVRVNVTDELGEWHAIGVGNRPGYPKYDGKGVGSWSMIPEVSVIKGEIHAGQGTPMVRKQRDELIRANEKYIHHIIESIHDEAFQKELNDMFAGGGYTGGENPIDVFMAIAQQNRDVFLPWQYNLLRKKVVQAVSYDLKPPGEKKAMLDRITAKHKEHLLDIFGHSETNQHIDVAITRSGMSALEAAYVLADNCVETPCVYRQEGWYFESYPPGPWQKVKSATEANVLLMSAAPNGPDFRGEANYRLDQVYAVQSLLKNATDNPDAHYVIIHDKTSDMLEDSGIPKNELPFNVSLIEVSSITKHQRGVQTEFFGAVAARGNIPSGLLDESVTRVMGEPTPDSIFAFPRLTIEELKRNKLKMKHLSDAFSEALSQSQADLTADRQWRWQPWAMYGYLIQPKRFFKDKRYTNLSESRAEVPLEAMYSFMRNHPELAIDEGEGFGMSQTRITHHTADASTRIGYIETVRIGMGLDTPVHEIRALARAIGEDIAASHRKDG